MKVALYRVGNCWAVKTPYQELLCNSIHDAINVACRHAKTTGDASADFRGQ